jgi:hypothetical protein
MSKITIDNGTLKLELKDLTSEEARIVLKQIYISISRLNCPLVYHSNNSSLIIPYKLLSDSTITTEPPIPDFLNEILNYDSQA